jgi:hypothetical protein
MSKRDKRDTSGLREEGPKMGAKTGGESRVDETFNKNRN